MILVVLLGVLWIASPALAETSISVRAGSSGFEFGFLYSDHYHAKESVVRHCVETLDEPDLVVALHLSRLSDIELKVIVDWRQKGLSWHEITHRCRLSPEVYYVKLDRDPGPPYGRAWGHWKKRSKKEIVLSDEEIRAFAILRAMSDYTGQTATHIVEQRKKGRSPGDIARGSRKAKSAMSEDTSAPAPAHGKAKGKGKAKGHQK